MIALLAAGYDVWGVFTVGYLFGFGGCAEIWKKKKFIKFFKGTVSEQFKSFRWDRKVFDGTVSEIFYKCVGGTVLGSVRRRGWCGCSMWCGGGVGPQSSRGTAFRIGAYIVGG